MDETTKENFLGLAELINHDLSFLMQAIEEHQPITSLRSKIDQIRFELNDLINLAIPEEE